MAGQPGHRMRELKTINGRLSPGFQFWIPKEARCLSLSSLADPLPCRLRVFSLETMHIPSGPLVHGQDYSGTMEIREFVKCKKETELSLVPGGGVYECMGLRLSIGLFAWRAGMSGCGFS